VSKPLIGIPAAHFGPRRIARWTRGGFATPDTYVTALQRGGARAVLLTTPEDDTEELITELDGVLLAGGGDIDPSSYGETAIHEATEGVEADRDAIEIGLVHAAYRLGVPLLGICRGFQVVNIAFGGTLVQHLPDNAALLAHRGVGASSWVDHDLRVAPGSRLASALGATEARGSASHHQGVERIGSGLVATAWTGDGLVEGLEAERGWLVAVQWHPEMTAASDPVAQSLFTSFVTEVEHQRKLHTS